MKKGDLLITKNSQKKYQIVGRWEKDIVLADTSDDSEEVLIYTATEIEELISEGKFRKLYKTGIPAKA